MHVGDEILKQRHRPFPVKSPKALQINWRHIGLALPINLCDKYRSCGELELSGPRWNLAIVRTQKCELG